MIPIGEKNQWVFFKIKVQNICLQILKSHVSFSMILIWRLFRSLKYKTWRKKVFDHFFCEFSLKKKAAMKTNLDGFLCQPCLAEWLSSRPSGWPPRPYGCLETLRLTSRALQLASRPYDWPSDPMIGLPGSSRPPDPQADLSDLLACFHTLRLAPQTFWLASQALWLASRSSQACCLAIQSFRMVYHALWLAYQALWLASRNSTWPNMPSG